MRIITYDGRGVEMRIVLYIIYIVIGRTRCTTTAIMYNISMRILFCLDEDTSSGVGGIMYNYYYFGWSGHKLKDCRVRGFIIVGRRQGRFQYHRLLYETKLRDNIIITTTVYIRSYINHRVPTI